METIHITMCSYCHKEQATGQLESEHPAMALPIGESCLERLRNLGDTGQHLTIEGATVDTCVVDSNRLFVRLWNKFKMRFKRLPASLK